MPASFAANARVNSERWPRVSDAFGNCKLLILHPIGIVIDPSAIVGPNCLIFQKVTFDEGPDGAPKIEGHADIGAVAKVLGNINLGDHAKIGAIAVVLRDVPAYATAVGVPANIILARDNENA